MSDAREMVSAFEAAEMLKRMDDVLLVTHRRPDGDTVGSAAALCRALRSLGKRAYVFQNSDNIPRLLQYLDGLFPPEGFEPKHVVSVDIATKWLFPINGMELCDRVGLVIDHHPSNAGIGKYVCVDASCAACGELMYEIIMLLCGSLSAECAEPLYLAVSTDTGCFRYSNTTANTHRVAVELIKTGIGFRAINKKMFETKSLARLRLEAALVREAEIFDEGKIVITALSNKMAAELGVTPDDEDDIAGIVRAMEGVLVAATVRETEEGFSKISVRTSPGISATKICALLDGGGHENAGGCTVEAPLDEGRAEILKAIRAILNNG